MNWEIDGRRGDYNSKYIIISEVFGCMRREVFPEERLNFLFMRVSRTDGEEKKAEGLSQNCCSNRHSCTRIH